ncbi:MAG: metalloregulator ArsR/SmtB family transcription factor [Pseudomonadota bacterium]
MTYQLIFSALADPSRRHLFEQLRSGRRSVGELARTLPISRPAVSQHVKVLQRAGLVTVDTAGRRSLVSARQAGLDSLRDYVDGYWTDVLDAFGAAIHARQETDCD